MISLPGNARLLLSASFVALTLAACDTADERSEAHYQKGLELVEAGQTEKAMLEFRNALKLNQEAVAPRFEVAKLMLANQDFQGALGNFMRVVEIEPGHLEARANLARIYVYGQRWEDATRHIDAALEVAPKDTEIRALKATVEYRNGDKARALDMARAVLADEPDNGPAAVVLIGDRINEKDFQGALGLIEEALVHNSQDQGINFLKLAALEQMGDNEGVGTHLREMTRLFPENRNIAQSLVQWHLAKKDEDGAEVALREIYERFPEEPENALNIVRFLRQTKGVDVARAELLRLVEGDAHKPAFTRALAAFDFQNGQTEDAITLLQGALGDMEDGTEKLTTQTALANFLRIEGQDDAAKELLETVIAADEENVDALKLRANYAIDEDRPQDAIQDLRTALGASPQDANILTLLASAHERNGSRGLAQERLALAVQVSENAPDTSLRYARFLMRDNNLDVAANVLTDALSRAPRNTQLIIEQARLQLRRENWSSAREMAERLKAIDTPETQNAARAIEASILGGQDDFEGTIALIEEMREGAGSLSAGLPALVATHLRAGNPDKAMQEIRKVLDQDPDDLRANLTLAQFEVQNGNNDKAIAIFEAMIEAYPRQAASYIGLSTLLRRTGATDKANEVVLAGIEKAANPGRLMFDRASFLESIGDVDGAIAIYEELYASNNTSEVLANNLASLLSEHRPDAESQERAYAVAKRLRASEVPAFQDTYGWLLYKRGEYERALVSLTKAAEGGNGQGGLANHPLVQFHLGMTYLKLERRADARTHLSRALELSGEDFTRYPQLADLKSLLSTL